MEYTEEENEAIKECESLIKKEYYGDMYFYERRSIQIILNLLQKQQKEIERLYKDNYRLDRENQLKFERAVDTSDYIPKEAIREKMKQLEITDCTIRYDKYDIQDILKELLGE